MSVKMKYWQTAFDFDEGVYSFFAPRKVSIVDTDFAFAKAGWIISIHPDFYENLSVKRYNEKLLFFLL